MIKYTQQEMGLINHFEKETKTTIKDCIIEPNSITFIVKKGDIGKAVGKQGSIIKRIKKEIGKEVNVYEHSDKPEEFIKNLLFPVNIKNIEIQNNTETVKVKKKNKKRAIGKEKKKIKKVREILKRHYPNITEVKII